MKKKFNIMLCTLIGVLSACNEYDFDQEQYRNEVGLLSNSSLIYDRQVANVGQEKDTIYLVADSGSAIVGFCGLWCFMEDADLCHIAVAPEQRSQGIATQLLGMAITECEHRGVKRILLEVRASNTAAIHCYHQMGFVQIGIRKKYYSQPKEDALLLEHQITNN